MDRLLRIIQKDPKVLTNSSTADSDELPMPSEQTINALHEKAISRITHIVRMTGNGRHSDAEIIAAKGLLDRSAQSMIR